VSFSIQGASRGVLILFLLYATTYSAWCSVNYRMRATGAVYHNKHLTWSSTVKGKKLAPSEAYVDLLRSDDMSGEFTYVLHCKHGAFRDSG
jgi:hypothetical protein